IFPVYTVISFVISDIPALEPTFPQRPFVFNDIPASVVQKRILFLRLPPRCCHSERTGAERPRRGGSGLFRRRTAGEIDSRSATPEWFTLKADEKIAFSGPRGLVVSRTGKGAEVADVPWNIRCESIRYNCSPQKGSLSSLKFRPPHPKEVNKSRLCK